MKRLFLLVYIQEETYEKKYNEFYENFEKFTEKRHMMSEYVEV